MNPQQLLAERMAAFLATTYRVDPPDGRHADLRVGQGHPQLDQWLERHGVRHWTFLTACNPMSQLVDPAQNQERMAELRAALAAEGWIFWPGAGIGDDGAWPAEPSVLILGMAEAAGRAWARRFQQLAIVCGEHGGPARLVGCAGQ